MQVIKTAISPLVLRTCWLLASLVVLQGCSSSDDDTSTAGTGSTDTSDSESAMDWVINNDGETSEHMFLSGVAAAVNVQSAMSANDVTTVVATGIPAYKTTMTQELHDALVSRPNASADFSSGTTSATVGDIVSFGANIGYNSSADCTENEGDGYWPPGPVCPIPSTKTGVFPDTPAESATTCETGLGATGYYVNGVSVYNWGDGQTYNNSGMWSNSAAVAEQYDIDICDGHAANGDYHHHFYSACLADLVGDDQSTHSPVYGYAADGYPIHGPWLANGELAISSWVARDYADANKPYSCDGNGTRTCVMVDEYDPSQGTTPADTTGPDVTATVTTLSGNEVTAESGFYYEDYYWDSALTDQSGAYLDQHNGHDHDSLGYHYHLTLKAVDGSMKPAFPYTFGPGFYGELQETSLTSCSTGMGFPPPPGGGG